MLNHTEEYLNWIIPDFATGLLAFRGLYNSDQADGASDRYACSGYQTLWEDPVVLRTEREGPNRI